ncbi:FAD-binding oxidoreductase [Nocardia australiensis]|uniref:FAD-binding oxidoreductase n=1 Tax=Nocardia australiensis TaxID=2887191 RepID=UPI001D13BD7E|nr:FAD-binding oxidoreductase [Nocardia australiensis]
MEITKTDFQALDQYVDGTVYTGTQDPEDRAGAQLLAPHHPAVVLEARSAEDVSRAVAFAADHGMQVAVQATGHGRTRALDGGLLIDTGRMREVRVDAATRRAWVPAGATWQHVIEQAAPHGLAPLSGSLPTVGAVAYTLGGGVGLLARRYGYSADHVTRFEAVTADGKIRQVSPEDEPDLFWALRGGGGNLAVVTGMEIDLMPVAELYGGSLMFDLAKSPEVLTAWTMWTRSVPEAMTSAVVVIPFPDIPMIPADVRGRQVVQLQVSFAGPEEEGRRLVEPLLRAGSQLRNTLRTLPYTQSGAVSDEPDRPAAYRGKSVLVDDLDPRALTALAHRAGATPGGCTVGVRHLGGALARNPNVPNAVGHRSAQYSVGVLSLLHDGDPSGVSQVQDELLAPFAPHRLGLSLNFTFGPLEPDQVRSAFTPADADRLGEITARYDPRGVLYANHPIPSPGPLNDSAVDLI